MDDAPPPTATDADRDETEDPAPSDRLPRFHLDPVGGIAGDMVAAALLDARPELGDGLREALAGLGLPPSVTIAIDPHQDDALAGLRFRVSIAGRAGHGHVRLADVGERLEAARIAPGVRRRARAIFTLLAEAEGAVHGTDPAEVAFHEVGAWDSTVDIVAAAFLIEALGPARWTAGAVPPRLREGALRPRPAAAAGARRGPPPARVRHPR